MRFAAIIVCAAIIAALPGKAMPQAGSTGGTIGKMDKSISGGEERTPQKRRKAIDDKKPTESEKGCVRIVGTWNWVWGFTRIFLPAGRIPSNDRGGGTWTCKGDNYVAKFADGSEDRLKMSSDGDSMSGTSSVTGFDNSFTVHRRQ